MAATSVSSMLKTFKKDLGEKIGDYRGSLEQAERVPTGFFAFDLATGGGFPRGCVSLVYGPESSGKTNLALKAIATHQSMWPNQVCVFVDVENSFDPAWAALLGVDIDKLVVMHPDYAEQAVDIIEGFLAADDCGVVVLDSVGALMTQAIGEKSASESTYGGAGATMSKLCMKIVAQKNAAAKRGAPPKTVILISHLMMKVGMVFGSPITISGGSKQKFLSALTVKVTGKNVIDAKVSKVMPIAKDTEFVIEKWKVPITAANGKYTMATRPHNGLAIGECDDWNTVSKLLQALNLLVKGEKGGWLLYDKNYPTLIACRDKLLADVAYGRAVRAALIQRVVADNVGLPDTEAD